MRKTIILIFVLTILIPLSTNCWSRQGFPCKEEEAAHRWGGTDFELIVCSYGSPPFEFKKGWWRTTGLSFYKITMENSEKKRILIKDHGEIYPDIEYSFHNDTITFIVYTHDPRVKSNVPFVKEEILLKSEQINSKFFLLLEKPKSDPEDVEKLFALLLMPEDEFKKEYPDDKHRGEIIDSALYKLRNYGLIDPYSIHKRLYDLRQSAWWVDGYLSVMLRHILNELEIIKQAIRR